MNLFWKTAARAGVIVIGLLGSPALAVAQQPVEPGRQAFVAGDYAGAMSVWLPLAEGGDAHAQFNVGLLFDEGLGRDPNPEEAQRWWQMAAAQGLAEAHHNLALLDLDQASENSETADLSASFRHLKAAADAGYAPAQYTLGKLHEYGLGVEQDPGTAVSHILAAAEGGFDKAQYNMGKRYRDGDGVPQSLERAAEWFRRAALAGHSGAQDHYARRLRDGDGVAPDPVTAMMMAILAARAGHEAALDLANDMKVPLSIEELDQAFTRANAFEPAVAKGPVDISID